MLKIIAKITVLCLFVFTSAAQVLAEDQTIKVGVITALTGMADKWSRYQNMGIELAKEDLALQNQKFEIVYEDSATNSAKAISAFNKLNSVDRVNAIITNDFGHILTPVIPLIKRNKLFSLTISSPNLKSCDLAPGYFYSVTSQLARSARVYEKFFNLNPEIKKIALYVFDDPEWGTVHENIWRNIAQKRKLEIVDVYKDLEFTSDFKTPMTKTLNLKPDAILVAHNPLPFLKVKNQLKYSGKVIFPNNILEMLATNESHDELINGVYFADVLISEEFRSKFKNRFNTEPILEAYAGYEALQSIAKAYEFNPKEPELGIQNVVYQGVSGKVDFTQGHCNANLSDFGLFRFEGGKIRQIK